MLTLYKSVNRSFQIMLLLSVVLILGACNQKSIHEESFSLYMNGKDYSELLQSVKSYASHHGYHVTINELVGEKPENLSRHMMIEGSGTRILLQSALSEQCKELDGRRNVAYSRRLFDVNVFSTSSFQPRTNVAKQTGEFKIMLRQSGFRIPTNLESCQLL